MPAMTMPSDAVIQKMITGSRVSRTICQRICVIVRSQMMLIAPMTMKNASASSAMGDPYRIIVPSRGMKPPVERVESERQKASNVGIPESVRAMKQAAVRALSVSYTHLRAHETDSYLVCRLLL